MAADPTHEKDDGHWRDVTDEEWRARLSPLQFEVTRRKATEPRGTGRYLHELKSGTYRCVCCGLDLFESTGKYDSGCGWPAFFEPTEAGNVAERSDASHGLVRTEITCRRCGAHLGHVFQDGPAPTGRRYCVNGASLDLDPDR